tara:strand:+ start:216643 stop:217236 length:594 start_codon:yes stop_codon:yes gene_type:complete
MTDSQKIDAYISKHSVWSEKLSKLRAIFNETELLEEVKWGAPAYTLNGKIILGMAAFKNHMGIWFHQGVFLKDRANKLINAQEEKTKALRQWRFVQNDTVEESLVREYVREAIENSLAGKELKPTRKSLSVGPFLKKELQNDAELNRAFKSLTPGKQREYADHINEAKRDATKQSRLEKIIPMIKEGIGLHDKYKNC